MPGKPSAIPGAAEDQGQSTAHLGEGEGVGVSETVGAESVDGPVDGEVGEDVGDVEEGAEGGSTGGEEGRLDGSQGGEEIQEEEEESQGESIPEEEGAAAQNEEEAGLAEGDKLNGDGTDPGEELGEAGEEGESEESPNYLVAAGSAYPCPSPGYFSLTGSCREFWVCKEVERYKIVDFQSKPVFQTNILGWAWPFISRAAIPVSKALPL